jgi:uncharacterized protein YecE (DUF72 family)
MEVFAGTSGFSYQEWKGHFYPVDLADDALLGYDAARLPTVEINDTFYRMPRADMLAGWTERVPPGFRFILEAPQRITHKSRLEETADAVAYLWKTAGSLGSHLGPFLFQLPPSLRANQDKLRGFLRELPSGMRAAFEFQHASWFRPAVFDALLEELDVWAGRLRAATAAWAAVYVFFKHEEEGAAPAMALRMAARFSPAVRPSDHGSDPFDRAQTVRGAQMQGGR